MKTILLKKLRGAFLFSIFILISTTISAQTYISGTISQDSTLSLTGSPYIVQSNLYINSGVTMTVDSGVTVKFNSNVNFYIYGTLNATNATFTSSADTPAPGDWGYFQVGNYYNTGTATLNSCEVNYMYRMNVDQGTITLTNTDILNSSDYAVYMSSSNSNFNMTGGNITTSNSDAKNSEYGIYVHSDSHAMLSGVSIQNYYNGIRIYENSHVSIENMNISNCYYPISIESTAVFTASGTNNLTGNTYDAVKMDYSNAYADFELPTLSIPYFFNNSFYVREGYTMTVGSNNILKFGNYDRLYVYGGLNAIANQNEHIYFTSYTDDNLGGDTNGDGVTTAPTSQKWGGIYFQPSTIDSASILRRCTVRYAGYSQIGGISTSDASPTIDSCTISNNYIGIYMQGVSNPVISNCEIGSSEMTPLAMSFEADPVMSNNTLSFSDNAYDAIGVIGGTMTANGTLKVRTFTDVPNITYLLLGQITVPAEDTLTIEKGITLKAYGQYYSDLRIIVNGTLIADGTSDEMINFTSARDDNYGNPADCNKDGTITSPEIGNWGGIIFNPGSNGLLDYCRLKYARVYSYSYENCNNWEYTNDAAIVMIDADPTISNCEFKDLTYAISCYRSASPVLENNSMVNIASTPINIAGPSDPTISGTTFTNVGWRALGLLGGNVCLDGTIKQRNIAGFNNITYVLLSDMTINSGANLTIDPGVVIKVMDQYTSIYNDGGLRINGTASEPVTITSVKDDNAGNPYDTNGDGNASTPNAGDWENVMFRSTTDDTFSHVQYADIKYAGRSGKGGITFENASCPLENSTITNSSYYGVYCDGNSAPLIDSVSIMNCSRDPVAMSLTANPTFNNIKFVSNFSQAIKIIEGTLSTNATLAPRSLAGINNIAYVVDRLTISSNAKLTILPDVVIKFLSNTYWYHNSGIEVYGNLIANGTADHKIYFTSFKDDSRGGDSNNNGNSDAPEKGDWGGNSYSYYWNGTPGGIKFFNNTIVSDTVNSMKYCEISYPGTGIRVENAHANISNSTIQLCNYFGTTIVGSANPLFTDCQFNNINYTPVELSMFSNPQFSGCSALNVGYMGLGVVPETYSKSDTVPIRSFGGYDNISYLMEAPCTINSGSTITIPAGVVFKSNEYIYTLNASHNYQNSGYEANGFIVNGKIIVEGTADNPVVFTNAQDDNYGNPLDMNQNGSATMPPDGSYSSWAGAWFTFNDVSDDSSSIKNAIIKYGNTGVVMNSASPSIDSVWFESLYYGADMVGVSVPKIDNSTFNNLQYYPMQISLVAYPSSTNNDLISGTTYKGIKVRDETLTQEVVLPKRDFGGVADIPYIFNRYYIGTSASLTIEPGVICKFPDDYYDNPRIDVSRGLIAVGGSTPDSTIVFTSLYDDFYGGDTNSDGDATTPQPSRWYGINFSDQSLDPMCHMKNVIFRFADAGITTVNASPTIENCNFNNNYYGVRIGGASNPVIHNCDFSQNQYYGVKNVDKSFDVDATNSWWGSNDGPTVNDNESSNSNAQQIVTTSVDYDPWINSGSINPMTGDVSLNGLIQAYDASMVLKYAVGLTTLDAKQLQVGDVNGNGEVTSYDASYILQEVVGLISTFPVNDNTLLLAGPSTIRAEAPDNVSLSIDDATIDNIGEFTIPVTISNITNMLSVDIEFRFNPKFINATSVENMTSNMGTEYNIDNHSGTVRVAMATSTADNNSELLSLKFKSVATQAGLSEITTDKFLVNDKEFTQVTKPGTINVLDNATVLNNPDAGQLVGMEKVYPNPVSNNARLNFHVYADSKWVDISVYNMLGQKVVALVSGVYNTGDYSVTISADANNLTSGTYIVRMQTNDFTQTQLLQVNKK